MPTVCTASQGSIHRPSFEESDCLPSNPTRRFEPLSATSTLFASSVWRVKFVILNRTSGSTFLGRIKQRNTLLYIRPGRFISFSQHLRLTLDRARDSHSPCVLRPARSQLSLYSSQQLSFHRKEDKGVAGARYRFPTQFVELQIGTVHPSPENTKGG
jgi:hypothetical protein